MKKIAHLSDLHFGRQVPAVQQTLLADLHQQAPDLIIISGDLTQRAKREEFMAAAEFIEQLPAPTLVVPGNHDLPLWRFWRRLLQPLRHYRQLIHPVDQPYWQNEEFAIFGLNTASRWTWKSGVLSRRQIAQMQRFFGTNDAQVRLVVSHHPLLSELNEGKKHIFKLGSLRAVLAENAIDILLSGHLHQSKIADVEVARLDSSHTCISIQAGTAISERYRTEANAYNILNIESAGLGVAVRGYNHVKFDQKYRIEFTKKNRVWQMKNKQIAG